MAELEIRIPYEEDKPLDPKIADWVKRHPPGVTVRAHPSPGLPDPGVSVTSDDMAAGIPGDGSESPIDDAGTWGKYAVMRNDATQWVKSQNRWVLFVVGILAFSLIAFCAVTSGDPDATPTTTTAAAPAQGQGNTITLTMTEDCPIIGSWSGYFTEADGDRSEDTFASELPWCQRETELTLTQNDNGVYVVGANKAAKVEVNPIREGSELTDEQLIHFNREGARETGCLQRGWEEFKPQLEAHLADKILKQTGQDVRVRLNDAPSGVEPTGTIEQLPPDSAALEWAAVEVECTTGSE